MQKKIKKNLFYFTRFRQMKFMETQIKLEIHQMKVLLITQVHLIQHQKLVQTI